jgi:hypothetical protein
MKVPRDMTAEELSWEAWEDGPKPASLVQLDQEWREFEAAYKAEHGFSYVPEGFYKTKPPGKCPYCGQIVSAWVDKEN